MVTSTLGRTPSGEPQSSIGNYSKAMYSTRTSSPVKNASPKVPDSFTKVTTITKTTKTVSHNVEEEEEEKIVETYEHKLTNPNNISPKRSYLMDSLRENNESLSISLTMHVNWRKGLGAKGSAWESRACVLIAQDLLIIGGSDSNDSQLYICDTNTLQWSGAGLNGQGPHSSKYYCSLPSPQGDRLFLLYPVREAGLHARVSHSYEAGDRTKLTVKQGQYVTVLEHFDSDWVKGVTVDDRYGFLPQSCIKYDTQNNDWNNKSFSRLEVITLNFQSNMLWTSMPTFGTPPQARREFTCTMLGLKIFLFGGIDDSDTAHNDMYILDTVDYKWTLCSCGTDQQKPPPRYGHSATLLEPNYIIVFGGQNNEQFYNDLYLFNTETLEWMNIEIDTNVSPRSNHSLIKVNENLLLFGGKDNEKLFNDVHALNIETNTWMNVNITGEQPSGRFRHYAAALDQSIVIFGGLDNDGPIFDIYFLEVEKVEEDVKVAPTHTTYSIQQSPTKSPQRRSGLSPEQKQQKRETEFVDQALNEVQEEQQRIIDHESEHNDSMISINSESSSELITPTKPSHTTPPNYDSEKSSSKEDSFEEPSASPTPVTYRQVPSTPPTTTSPVVLTPNSVQPLQARTPQTPDQFEFKVNFSEHLFLNESSSPEKTATISPKPVQQAETTEPVYNYTVDPDTKEVFAFLANPDGLVSLPCLLRLCRNCKILKNWITLGNIIEIVGRTLQLKEIQGSEMLTLDQFVHVLIEVTSKKFKKSREDAQGYLVHLIEGNIKPYYRYTLVKDDVLDQLIKPSVLHVFHRHGKHLRELFAFYSLLLHNSQHQTQLHQRDVLRTDNTISLAEFNSFTDTFEITPQIISKHVVMRIIFPQSHANFLPKSIIDEEEEEVAPLIVATSTTLNYPEFQDALGRIAIYAYSKYPFTDLLKTVEEKIENLFDNLGFNDNKKYQAFMKNAGLNIIQVHPQPSHPHQSSVISSSIPPYAQMANIPNRHVTLGKAVTPNAKKATPKTPKAETLPPSGFVLNQEPRTTKTPTSARTRTPSTKTPNVSAKPATPSFGKYEHLLSNKVKMKEELQRIFMYYCSFGNRMNMDLMSSSKFVMFARDVNLLRHNIKQQELDLVFVSVLSGNVVQSKAKQKLTFTHFIAALKALSARIYSNVSPSHALVQFFVKDVFPNAKRLSDKNDKIDLNDAKLLTLLANNHKNLQKLFYFYCNTDDIGQSKRYQVSESASCSEFLRLVSDFDMIPKFVSKKDVYRIFRSTIMENALDTNEVVANSNEEIVYPQFVECIVKIAQLAYSKHPYDKKYQTISERTSALLTKFGIKDWRMILKKLEKIGRRVTGFSATMETINNNNRAAQTQQVHYHSLSTSTGDVDTSELSHINDEDLPSELELESKLRDIFAFYVQIGDHANNHVFMKATQFTRFVRDTRIVDTVSLSNDMKLGTVLPQIEAELVYVEMTKNSNMNYEVFCDSLAVLASKKFCRSDNPHQQMTSPQALRHLLIYHILPFARTRRNVHHLDTDDAVTELLKHDQQLHKIFLRYCKLEYVSGDSPTKRDALLDNNKMSNQELQRFCRTFNLCPALLSLNDINDVFLSVVRGDMQDEYAEDESHVPPHWTIAYPGFIDCLAKFSQLITIGGSHWAETTTSAEKAKLLIDRLDLTSSVRLNATLDRDVHSFSIMVSSPSKKLVQ